MLQDHIHNLESKKALKIRIQRNLVFSGLNFIFIIHNQVNVSLSTISCSRCRVANMQLSEKIIIFILHNSLSRVEATKYRIKRYGLTFLLQKVNISKVDHHPLSCNVYYKT